MCSSDLQFHRGERHDQVTDQQTSDAKRCRGSGSSAREADAGQFAGGAARGGQPEDDEPGGGALCRQAPIQCCRVHAAEVGGGPVQGEGEDRAHDRAAEVRADLRIDGTYRGP